jgi:hypothetical protein
MGWPLCQEVCFRVVGSTWVCISIDIVISGSALEKSVRVMTLRVLGIGYSPVRNLAPLHRGLPYLVLNCHPILQS